jgi:hypothetical protein
MKLIEITTIDNRTYINTTATVVAQGFNSKAYAGMPEVRVFWAGQKIKCKDLNHAKMIASRIEKTARLYDK